MGGLKIKEKMPLILKMLDVVDEMIIGGAMSYTFNKVLHDINIGKSIFD